MKVKRAVQRAPPQPGGRQRQDLFSLPVLLPVFALVAVALATLFLVQFLAFAGTTDATFRAAIAHEFAGLPQERAARALAASFPKGIAAYGAGLLFVEGVAGPGERFNYFLGEVSGRGRPLYFPVALAVKLTTATVLAGAVVILAAGLAFFRSPRLRRLLFARAWLPAALGGAYLAAACASNVNIGVRHVLPVVPFVLVAGAAALRTVVRRRRVVAAALATIVLAASAEAAARLGREISFGNLLAGGPAGIPALLSDSNVDWGQEQGMVFARVRRGDLGRVGLTTLIVDESGARAAGIAGQAMTPDAPLDTVFFSRFLWDTAAAMEKNSEPGRNSSGFAAGCRPSAADSRRARSRSSRSATRSSCCACALASQINEPNESFSPRHRQCNQLK